MRVSRKLTTLGAAAAASAAIAVMPAGTANAATPCSKAGFTRTDPNGVTRAAYNCSNVANTPVYSSEWGGGPVGYLYTSTNWFVCEDDYGGSVGGPHPNRWEYTEADNYKWGWVKDTDIYSETNSLPPCFG